MGYQTLDVRCDGCVFGYVDDPRRRIAARSVGSATAVSDVLNKVCAPAVDALLAGFAVENSYMKTLLGIPAVQDHLKALADLQEADHERDLPGTIAQSLPVAVH